MAYTKDAKLRKFAFSQSLSNITNEERFRHSARELAVEQKLFPWKLSFIIQEREGFLGTFHQEK